MRICYTSVHDWAILRVNFGIQIHYTIQYQWSICIVKNSSSCSGTPGNGLNGGPMRLAVGHGFGPWFPPSHPRERPLGLCRKRRGHRDLWKMEKPKNKEPMLLSFCWVHIDRKGLRDGVSKIHEFVRAYSSCSSCTATQRGRCSIGESYGSVRLFGLVPCLLSRVQNPKTQIVWMHISWLWLDFGLGASKSHLPLRPLLLLAQAIVRTISEPCTCILIFYYTLNFINPGHCISWMNIPNSLPANINSQKNIVLVQYWIYFWGSMRPFEGCM